MFARRLKLVCGLVAASSLGVSSARVDAAPAPAITVEKPAHDFGTVAEGGPVRHFFKVKNTGDAPLEIHSVSASCGCTAAAPKEKLIAPGKNGEIEVTFDTSGRPGKTEKSVTVASNDPKTPALKLVIKVNVEQLLGLEPAFTYLQAAAGEQPRAEVWLSGKLATKGKLAVARMEPPGKLRVEPIERKTDRGKQRGLRIGLAQQQPGEGMVKVIVATGVTARPELEHAVHWSLRGNLDAPRSIHFDLGQPGQGERIIQVTSQRPDFQLKTARVVEGPFQATLLPGAPNAQRSIKLTTTLAAAPPAHTKGKLVLESNDPLEPTREVALSLAALRSTSR